MAINVLDIGFGILVLLFVVRAILQGVVQELGGLIGIFLGFVVAGRMYQQLVPQFAGIVDNAFLAGLISYGILFAATLIVVALLSSLLKNFLAIALPGWLDSTLAACVGFAKGCFVCGVGLAIMQEYVPESPFLKKSVLVPYLDGVAAFAKSLLPGFLNQLPL